jgi:hypothetical protein
MSRSGFVDMTANASAFIGHSTEVIWPHLLNQAGWMKDFSIESISGEKNSVGEVKRVMPLDSSTEGFQLEEVHPCFFKTLLLVPFRKFVYKAYTEERAGEYGYTGLEVLTLEDVLLGSVVTVEVYLEFQSSTMDHAGLTAFVWQVRDLSAEIWKRNFPRLAQLIEGREYGR